MPLFSIQYLEDSPEIPTIPVDVARKRLRSAFERLPIAQVLIGWNLPDALREACAEECARAGTKFYRWHPLLTGDGKFMPKPEWQCIALNGDPIAGFRNMPEFTFVCSNRPVVRETILAHLREVLGRGHYQGVFLDRIRHPSPAGNLNQLLGCFCDDCQRVAAQEGLDLVVVREQILAFLKTADGIKQVVQALFKHDDGKEKTAAVTGLRTLLDFRVRTVNRMVEAAAQMAKEHHLEVGLDCWSATMTHMVGQDLAALTPHGDWTKVMTYGHTLGPAGIPYELLELADWLIEQCGFDEPEAMRLLTEASGLALPGNRIELKNPGLSSAALKAETQLARQVVDTLLAGIELVDMPGVTVLNNDQIRADVAAYREAGADGLAISWDLRHIPLEHLALVNQAWDE
jgi:hypothetical protein